MGDLEAFHLRTPRELLAALGQEENRAKGSLVSAPSAPMAPDAAAAGSSQPDTKLRYRSDAERNVGGHGALADGSDEDSYLEDVEKGSTRWGATAQPF